MRVIASSTRTLSARTSGPGAGGSRIVTDGDARFDTDVGGMSWFHIRIDDSEDWREATTTRPEGLRRDGQRRPIFEVMESRIMPRCVQHDRAWTLPYTSFLEGRTGHTDRPVKFGTITPRTHRHVNRQRQLFSQEPLLRDLSTAMRKNCSSWAQAVRASFDGRAQHSPIGIQRGSGTQFPVEFFVEWFNQTVRPAKPDGGLVPTCWGKPGQQRPLCDQSVL